MINSGVSKTSGSGYVLSVKEVGCYLAVSAPSEDEEIFKLSKRNIWMVKNWIMNFERLTVAAQQMRTS